MLTTHEGVRTSLRTSPWWLRLHKGPLYFLQEQISLEEKTPDVPDVAPEVDNPPPDMRAKTPTIEERPESEVKLGFTNIRHSITYFQMNPQLFFWCFIDVKICQILQIIMPLSIFERSRVRDSDVSRRRRNTRSHRLCLHDRATSWKWTLPCRLSGQLRWTRRRRRTQECMKNSAKWLLLVQTQVQRVSHQLDLQALTSEIISLTFLSQMTLNTRTYHVARWPWRFTTTWEVKGCFVRWYSPHVSVGQTFPSSVLHRG